MGADCFNKSITAGEIVEINITSIAKSLGARSGKNEAWKLTYQKNEKIRVSVAPTLMEMLPHFNILSQVVTDGEAVEATVRLAG